MTAYKPIIDFVKTRLPAGDVLEVGALGGNGTRQLALAWPERTVYAIDLFDVDADPTVTADGTKLSDLYRGELQNRHQREVFAENVAGLRNVRLIVGDSRAVKWPGKLALVVIDGGHTPEVCEFDLRKALTRAPLVAVHDYHHDIPHVTEIVDRLAGAFHCRLHEVGNAFVVLARP